MASKSKVIWYGPQVKRRLNVQMERNLDRAGVMLETDIKRSFGNSGVVGERGGATKADRRKNRSAAFGPPNVDTGLLKRAVGFIRPGRLRRWIGTGLGSKEKTGYAKFLEFGTRYMAPRPFLRPALYRNRVRIEKLLGAKLR